MFRKIYMNCPAENLFVALYIYWFDIGIMNQEIVSMNEDNLKEI